MQFAYEDAVLVLGDGTRIPVTSEMTITKDVERVRSDREFKPDENWSFTDPAGHVHVYVRDENDVPRLPSLARRLRHLDCDGSCFAVTHGDCEGYDEVEWFCRECDAVVEPGFLPDTYASNPGIAVSEIIEYSFCAEFPPPKGKRSWRRPRTRTITIRASDPPMVGPIEDAVYEWSDPKEGRCRLQLPTLHAQGTDFQASAGGSLVLSVQLSGTEWRIVDRKPTGP